MKSHIIPKYIGKHIKQEEKKLVQISSAKVNNSNFKYPQDIIKEHMLCKKCEQLFEKYERAAKKIFFEYQDFDNIGDEKINRIIDVKNLEGHNQTLKYFFLSILWRTSVATFSDFSLNDNENILREQLLNEIEFATWDFPIYMFQINDNNLINNGIDFQYLVEYPRIVKTTNGERSVLTLFGYHIQIINSLNVRNQNFVEIPPSLEFKSGYFTIYNFDQYKQKYYNYLKDSFVDKT